MATRAHCRARPGGGERGLTLLELIVAGMVAAVVGLAIMTMYITSIDAWDTAGSRLTLQRGADHALERILADIRRGSRVVIGSGNTDMTIYRATVSGDSALVTYQLADGQLTNSFGVVLVENVSALQFTSGNGIKVGVSMDLLDDRGTDGTTADDTSIHIASTAVCRNQSLY